MKFYKDGFIRVSDDTVRDALVEVWETQHADDGTHYHLGP